MRSRIFERKGGRGIGRSEVKEEGLETLGSGKTVECFKAEGKVPLVRQEFKMKRRGSRQVGAESKSIRPENSYGFEEVSLMVFSMLYSSVIFIGKNWKLFWIIGAEERKKFFREDEQEEEGRELIKKLFRECGSRRWMGIVGEELLWPPKSVRFLQKSWEGRSVMEELRNARFSCLIADDVMLRSFL